MAADFRDPEAFTAGTIGTPGQRVFYLQAKDGPRVLSLRLEKQQVAALAEYLGGLLEDLPAPPGGPAAPDLTEPVVAEWVVGNIGVAYDNDHDRIVIVAEELRTEDISATDPEGLDGGEQARFLLTRSQVQAFIDRADDLVQGGRPPCPLCGRPMDAQGHACPRHN